jgi:hypothetical protein
VATTDIFERVRRGQPAAVGHRRSLEYPRPSRVSALIPSSLLAIGIYFCCNSALWAQASDSQNDNVNSTRTVESHSESDSRASDELSVQHRGPDGHFQPYQDIEKVTVQVDATTVRTTTRVFDRNADGAKILVETTEEEKRTSPSGESNVVRTTSDPDVNGNLQLVRRQIEETKQTSANVEETKTTVMLPGADGGLIPAAQVQERRERGANDLVQTQKTTLLPDGNGNWQVGEIRLTTTTQEGANRSTQQSVSLPDSEGRLHESSRTLANETVSASGEKDKTMETYSIDVPGAVADGSLHLVERVITTQYTSSTGQQTTAQQVEQSDPGDPRSGLRVTILTNDTVQPGSSGAQATRIVQALGANGTYGSMGVISVDMAKSDNIHAIQVQIAPSEKSK